MDKFARCQTDFLNRLKVARCQIFFARCQASLPSAKFGTWHPFSQHCQALISHGASVNLISEGYKGTHALFQAANGNHLEVLTTLLKSGASVDQPSKYATIDDFRHEGWTPLIVSAAKGHTRIVKTLLSHKADVNLVSEGRFGTHAMFEAANSNHIRVLSALLQARANVDQVARDRQTPLMVAAIKGHVESVKFLLDSGASVDYVGKREGWRDTGPAIVLAAWQGELECVKLLLHAGANISGMIGFRTLSLAAHKGHTKVLEFLLQNFFFFFTLDAHMRRTWYDHFTTPPLTAAACEGHYKAVEVLLKHGASPNEKGMNGCYNVLMSAVSRGQVHVVDLLLKSGACPNAIAPHSDRAGVCSTLHLAADYRVVDEWDGSPVYITGEAYEMIRLLLLAGANVKFRELISADPHVKVIKEGETGKDDRDDHHDKNDDEERVTEAKDNDWKCTVGEDEVQSALELMYEEAFSYDYDSAKSVHLLYAAGASIYEIGDKGDNASNEEDREVLQLIHTDQQPLLSLQGLCRRKIRAHLLEPTGGNHPNLITAMPQLPVPKTMQKFLLFDVPNIFEDYDDPCDFDNDDLEGEEEMDIPNSMEEGDE